MKKQLLFSMMLLLSGVSFLQAQNTYIVTDNTPRVTSCDDTLISLQDIYELTGMHDLDDASDDYTKYRMLELNGSLITSNVIAGPIKYSDYAQIYVEKTGTVFNGHNGVVIYLEKLTRPTSLFTQDTLKYIVDRGATKHYVEDFFGTLNLWDGGKNTMPLQDRIYFRDMSGSTEYTIQAFPNWAIQGAGLYRLRYETAGCSSIDIVKDSIFVKITETLCHSIQLKNLPAVCLDDVVDITPYVYVDGLVATSAEIADMTFYDRSRAITSGPAVTFDPTALDVAPMYSTNSGDPFYPKIEIVYQPNVDLNLGCAIYTPLLNTKLPMKFMTTNIVFANNGNTYYNIDDKPYYSFDGVFYKNVLDHLYLNYFPQFSGTTFTYYSDNTHTSVVNGADLAPGTYYVQATSTACADVSNFTITVQERDFNISWQSTPNSGTGYYTFSVPVYAGATYTWQIWGGGSIVSGLGTNQINVYYSQGLSRATTVSCIITLPTVRTSSTNTLGSELYFMPDGNGGVEEIPQTVTGVNNGQQLENISLFPNPAEGTFTISGEGVYEVKIFNAMGQQVYTNEAYTANSALTLNSKGVHYVQLSQNGKRGTIKVIVQ